MQRREKRNDKTCVVRKSRKWIFLNGFASQHPGLLMCLVDDARHTALAHAPPRIPERNPDPPESLRRGGEAKKRKILRCPKHLEWSLSSKAG